MSNATDMAACPFCAREVDADLIVYGGKCPSCFGEIPGEEAPTDPGEEKKAAEHKAVAAKVQRAKRLPILLATFTGLALVAATGFFVVSQLVGQPMPVLNLDDAEYDMGGTLVAWEAPKTAEVETPKTKNGGHKSSTSGTKVPGTDGSKLLGEDGTATVASGSATPGEGGVRKVGGPGSAESGSSGSASSGTVETTGSLDPQVTVRRRDQLGVQLVDDNQIIDMIKYVMQSELPKLRSCYESRLKQDASLSGSWLLEFTVQDNGKVGSASASGKEKSDSELEACVVAKVNAWQFQPIKQDQPVKKTLTFKPS